jgi:hypothetical protein
MQNDFTNNINNKSQTDQTKKSLDIKYKINSNQIDYIL